MKLNSTWATLRRFAPNQTGSKRLGFNEKCDFCSTMLFLQHRHLLEMANRKIICVCDACALTFEGVHGGRFKLIPRESRPLSHFQMSDAEWDNLALPIGLAFIFVNDSNGKPSAIYPSPAGPMESLIVLKNWQTIVGANPELEELKPDVEALLINRTGQGRDYFIVPIDACFELIGLVRKNWRGLSGGEKVWLEIRTFFERLREYNPESARLSPMEEMVHA